ncbi:hypothetical protein FBUS_08909 [Fasciolopsis buskii]|uniref:Uncharacterized protein n=1 Tax=Fasciolopsis buskii TaxID=27845 RepID=A0A8E0VMG1_9TREM|nr:hypothetical protein FBUS_08909 [Fasciolopsis buski]
MIFSGSRSFSLWTVTRARIKSRFPVGTVVPQAASPVPVRLIVRCSLFTFASVSTVFIGTVIWDFEHWRWKVARVKEGQLKGKSSIKTVGILDNVSLNFTCIYGFNSFSAESHHLLEDRLSRQMSTGVFCFVTYWSFWDTEALLDRSLYGGLSIVLMDLLLLCPCCSAYSHITASCISSSTCTCYRASLPPLLVSSEPVTSSRFLSEEVSSTNFVIFEFQFGCL